MPIFVVHEHHARHLHFDLRLEMGGALKSWAIPKGPTLDSAQKRLAIQVVDHELGYAAFSGTIAQGEYGAGEVAIWDAGEVAITGGDIDEGRLEFELTGEKLKGGFVLIRFKGKDKEWLLIKRKDEHAISGFVLRQVIG